jgi:hypothetical protein
MTKAWRRKISKFRLADRTDYTERDVKNRFCILALRNYEMEKKYWKRNIILNTAHIFDGITDTVRPDIDVGIANIQGVLYLCC